MAPMVRSGFWRARWLALLGISIVAVMALPAVAGAKKPKPKPKLTGAVYTETNSTSSNAVVAFAQYSDGSLKQIQTIGTGGKGGNQAQPETGPCLPPPAGVGSCPNLDTQGELETADAGKLVFAVNAGSNTITSFRVLTGGRLARADVAKSGGVFPLSLTTHGHWLYVLNTNSENIAGFKFNATGHLSPIKGSIKKLAANVFPGLSRQIAFNNSGKWLVVSKFGNPFATGGPSPAASIDTFKVASNGKPSAPITSNASVPLPFSINFDSGDRILLTEVGNPANEGFVDSFTLSSSGHLTPIQAPISSNGDAPCWGVITKKGFWYVVNADSLGPNGATVSVYKVTGGHLTFKSTTPQIGETLKTDEALSSNQKYLYVLAPTSNRQAGGSHIDEYEILPSGGLKLIGQTPKTLAKSVNGLASN
jgi:6-phosphogluconolactonase